MNTTTPAQMTIAETEPRDLVSDLAATMPTPTAPASPAAERSAPSAPQQTPSEPAPSRVSVSQGELIRDKLNRVFDPEKYASNPDGSPKLDRIGRFFSRKLGRKASATPAPSAPPQSFIPLDDPIAAPTALPPKTPATTGEIVENATAETIIGFIQTLLVLIGEEEGILTPLQKELIRGPLLRVLAKYEIGSDALPPEFDLLLAVVAVVIEKIKQGGKMATWFAKARAWAIDVIFRRKGAALGREVRREVPSDLVVNLAEQLRRIQAELAEAKAQKEAS